MSEERPESSEDKKRENKHAAYGCLFTVAIVVAAVSATVLIVGGNEESTSAPEVVAAPPEWYEGGTLHAASRQQWVDAPRRDRLATSADWVATLAWQELGNEGTMNAATYVATMYGTHDAETAQGYVDLLRTAAIELMTCVDEMYSENVGDRSNVAAALCASLLSYELSG